MTFFISYQQKVVECMWGLIGGILYTKGQDYEDCTAMNYKTDKKWFEYNMFQKFDITGNFIDFTCNDF